MIHVPNGHFVVLDGKDAGMSDLFLSGTPLIAASGEFQAQAPSISPRPDLGVAEAYYELTLLLNNDVNPLEPVGWISWWRN